MKGKAMCISIMALLFFSSVTMAASYKSIAKQDIRTALKLQKKLQKEKDLQGYIPYMNYYNGTNYLNKADYQYSEEGEYEIASYFAVLARVEFETAKAIAKTRMYRRKILIAERDEYREASKKGMLKAALARARLAKKGKSYYVSLEDKVIFKRRSLKLLEKGEEILNEINKVLKLFPESNLLIKGHTRIRDRSNSNSQRKADKIAEYLMTTKGIDESRIKTKGYGNSEPMEIRGRSRRVDRIEIYLFDID